MTHIPRASAPAVALLAFLTLSGCGADAPAEWQGSVRDSAGTRIVTNSGNGLWGPEDVWTVEQELVVGQAEGEPEYQFGQISGVDVGSDGRIYVVDQQAQEVRVFSPQGRFLSRIGKAGSGPGELSQAAGPIFAGPGDTLSVPDAMQQRVNRYTAAGESVGSYPLPMAEGIAVKWMETSDQSLVQQAMVMALPGQQDVEQKNLLLRRRPSGEIQDTVMELPIGKTVDFSGATPSITVFESEPTWAVGPDDRFYFGNSSVYRLEQYSPEGRLVRVIEKPVEPRPVSASDQTEFRRIFEDIWRRQGMPPEAVSMMGQALKFAEHYPAYANILGGPDGTLWVQAMQSPEEVREQGGTFNIQDMGSARWEVFDDEGRLLGTVTMPPRFTPVTFDEDVLYGIMLDEMDVQYVTRVRLNRGATDRVATDRVAG